MSVASALVAYAATVLSVFLAQYQNIVLAHFASNVEIGNFGATWVFTSFMMILIYPITTAMFPMFSKMDSKSREATLLEDLCWRSKYASLPMIPVSLAGMVFSRGLIHLTYSRGYALAPQYLALLSVLYLLTAIGYLVLGSFPGGVADTGIVVKSVLTLATYLPVGPALAWVWGPYGLLTHTLPLTQPQPSTEFMSRD